MIKIILGLVLIVVLASISFGIEPKPAYAGAPVEHPIIAMSSDGSELVSVYANPPSPLNGQQLSIRVGFMDTSERYIKHQNYNITVTQDGKTIFSKSTAYTDDGIDFEETNVLTSSDPVDIKVTLNGVGLPGTDPSTWTGPKGDIVTFHVVPEFGSLAEMIIITSMIGVLTISRKFRFHFSQNNS